MLCIYDFTLNIFLMPIYNVYIYYFTRFLHALKSRLSGVEVLMVAIYGGGGSGLQYLVFI